MPFNPGVFHLCGLYINNSRKWLKHVHHTHPTPMLASPLVSSPLQTPPTVYTTKLPQLILSTGMKMRNKYQVTSCWSNPLGEIPPTDTGYQVNINPHQFLLVPLEEIQWFYLANACISFKSRSKVWREEENCHLFYSQWCWEGHSVLVCDFNTTENTAVCVLYTQVRISMRPASWSRNWQLHFFIQPAKYELSLKLAYL